MNTNETAKIVTYIEENLRASPSAGLRFVDSRHFRSRLLSKQNHVVFGRRGAGKTSLVSSARGFDGHVDVYLNLEDYKDITFPNIVIHILLRLFASLNDKISSDIRLWRFRPAVRYVRKRLQSVVTDLTVYVHEPDTETQEVTTTSGHRQELNVSANVSRATAGEGVSREHGQQVTRALPRSKTEYLKLELTSY